MSIYLSFFYISKPAGSLHYPAACLLAVDISPNNEFAIGPFSSTGLACSILNSLMIDANLTLGEVIWIS